MEFDFAVRVRIVIRRFFELLILEVLLSAITTLLFVIKIITGLLTLIALAVFVIVFFGINVWQMRCCYFDMRDLKLHYLLNLVALLLFSLINIGISSFFGDQRWYTYLFALTKVFGMFVQSISSEVSAVIFNIICVVTVFLSPIGMTWIADMPAENPYFQEAL